MSFPVRIQHLLKRYRRAVAVDDLNLDIPEGAIYGLVGPNGAGKTTTIKTAMNIVQGDTGTIEILGADSRRLGPHEFQQIGYVSENQKLPEWMTLEYLLRYLQPFYPEWDDLLANEMIKQLDLPVDRKLRHLSRGMRMKAALVSALAYRPKLIILDEPFSGLDPLVRDEFIEGLLERAAGATMLISSHDLAELETFASHIGYLDRGRLQFSEEITQLNQRFREVEITLPQTAALPADWPARWLRPETSASMVRFIDSAYDPERTTAEVRRLFPGASNIEVHPMPLRSIFVTLARAMRKAA